MPIGNEEIVSRFSQHRADDPDDMDDQLRAHRRIMEMFIDTAQELDHMLPDGRAKSVMMTHLEDASMWANKAVSHQFPVVVDRPLR